MIYFFGFYIVILINFILSKFVQKRFFLYLAVITAFLFSALRFDAGYDYFNYLDLIMYADGFSYERLEVFNQYLITIARQINHPQIYFIVTSFLYVLFMVLGLKANNSFGVLSLSFVFFCIGFYLTSFDIIRQMVAVAIGFYGASLIFNNRLFLGVLFFALAYGFHRSAMVLLAIAVVGLLFSRKFNLFVYIIVFILGTLSSFLLIELVKSVGFYSSYIERGGNNTGFGVFLFLISLLICMFIWAKITCEESPDFWRAFNIFFVGVVVYAALLPFGYFVTRITYYNLPWLAVAFSLLYKNSRYYKSMIAANIFIVVSFSYFFSLYVTLDNPRIPLANYSFYFLKEL